jgi:hypothetical protein
MFKSISTRRVSGNTDEVALTFRCSGTIEDNYDDFLADAAEAVVQIKGSYEGAALVGNADYTNRLRQRVKHIPFQKTDFIRHAVPLRVQAGHFQGRPVTYFCFYRHGETFRLHREQAQLREVE